MTESENKKPDHGKVLSGWLSRTKSLLLNADFMMVFLAVLSVLIGIQQYFILPEKEFWGIVRPQYNNYLIFKNAFFHLINHQALYDFYPSEYGDLYKYSPSFAMFMGILAYLPDWTGLIIWNLLNTICLYFAIRLLPGYNDKSKSLMLWFILFELIGNLQNEQSNVLVTAFILLTFVSFERKNLFLAALFVTLGFYLKIYGVVAISLFLFYPGKLKFLLSLAIWFLIIFMLPLLFISPSELFVQYQGWWEVLLSDHNSRYGFSILGILHQWLGLDPSKWLVLAIGLIILCLPYCRVRYFQMLNYRLLFLAAILCWIILFNHTAEASGYIIAMTGCVIWYFTQDKSRANTILMVASFVLVSLIATDLVPASIRYQFIYPYYIRTFPILLIWCLILYDMLFGNIQANKNSLADEIKAI